MIKVSQVVEARGGLETHTQEQWHRPCAMRGHCCRMSVGYLCAVEVEATYPMDGGRTQEHKQVCLAKAAGMRGHCA